MKFNAVKMRLISKCFLDLTVSTEDKGDPFLEILVIILVHFLGGCILIYHQNFES